MGNVIFVVIFVIFCAFLLGAGLISKRWVKESSDFVLAGREISTPINVVGVIAIGFAGTTVTLAPGFTIQYGLLGGLGWGVIYSVCGLLIFGLLYSNFVRRSGAQTLPEFLEMRYDGHTRSVVAITSVIGMCGIMANNVVSSVDNIAAFTGWNRLAITAIIFAVIIVFTFVSGLWATTIRPVPGAHRRDCGARHLLHPGRTIRLAGRHQRQLGCRRLHEPGLCGGAARHEADLPLGV